MSKHPVLAAEVRVPVRRPNPIVDGDRRGVCLPAGADSKLFGGWGVRF